MEPKDLLLNTLQSATYSYLNQKNTFHNLPYDLFKIHFNIFHPFMPRTFK
jgi:hypothetical protein